MPVGVGDHVHNRAPVRRVVQAALAQRCTALHDSLIAADRAGGAPAGQSLGLSVEPKTGHPIEFVELATEW